MKKITAIMLAASMFFAVACQDKDEEVFEKATEDIRPDKSADDGKIGGGDFDEGP